MTWKQYATSKGIRPMDAWAYLLPQLQRAAPSELAHLWDDPHMRAWMQEQIDRLADHRQTENA